MALVPIMVKDNFIRDDVSNPLVLAVSRHKGIICYSACTQEETEAKEVEIV